LGIGEPTVPQVFPWPLASGDGTPLTAEEARNSYGFSAKILAKIQDITTRHDVIIDMRPTNPAAADFLEIGATGKPSAIKSKSLSSKDDIIAPADVISAAKAAPRVPHGLVGIVKPTVPVNAIPEDMRAHREARQREFSEGALIDWLRRFLRTENPRPGESIFRYRGLTFERDPRAGSRNQYVLIVADHDLWAIADATTGDRLNPTRHKAVLDALLSAGKFVRHGAIGDWEPKGREQQKIHADIMRAHFATGEPIVRIRPAMEKSEQVTATLINGWGHPWRPKETMATTPEPGLTSAANTSCALSLIGKRFYLGFRRVVSVRRKASIVNDEIRRKTRRDGRAL
jgi:hypothetical protein